MSILARFPLTCINWVVPVINLLFETSPPLPLQPPNPFTFPSETLQGDLSQPTAT